MKRVLFSMILAIASVVGGLQAFGAYSNDSPTLSDLAKANIEALASIPDAGTCYDTITGAKGIYTRYCQTCKVIEGKPSFWAEQGECP